MKASTLLKKAEAHREKMQAALDEIGRQLKPHLNDDAATVTFVPGDGWCISFGEAELTPVGFLDLDRLLSLDQADATQLLHKMSV